MAADFLNASKTYYYFILLQEYIDYSNVNKKTSKED